MPTPSRKRPGWAAATRWCDAATSVAGADHMFTMPVVTARRLVASSSSSARNRSAEGGPAGGKGAGGGDPADQDGAVAEGLDLLREARGELIPTPPDPDAAQFD